MELELRRTLDTLKWAPKVWRPERSWRSNHTAMRKVQSDPCFTSTFTKLPAVLNQNNIATPASSKAQGPSSPSRLMKGPCLQVDKVNNTSKAVSLPDLHSGVQSEPRMTVVRGCSRKTTINRGTADLEDQLKEFENSLEEVQASVHGIHTAVETFEGIAQGNNRKSMTKRGSRLSLQSLRSKLNDDEGDKVEESWKARLLQYRYVRKIEPEAPPLERLPEEECPRIEEGHIMLRNQSEEYLRNFTTKGRKNVKLEVFAKRDKLQKDAQAKRLGLEQQQEAQRLEKMALYRERMTMLATRQTAVKMESEVQGTEARLKEMQTHKWQSLLAIIGFMQMCSLLHEKYNSVKSDYVSYLQKENLAFMDPGNPSRGLAAFLGEYLLYMRFVEVARKQMKEEWRLPPKMRSVWHASVRSGPKQKQIENLDATHKQPKANERNRSKERPRTTDAVKHFYVEFPSLPDMLSHQRNALFLQAILVGKFRQRKRRRASEKIAECLNKWKQPGNFLVCMMNRVKHVKRIQRFWRWARKHWMEVRAKLEAEWIRVEKSIVETNFHASSGKDASHGSYHRKTAFDAHSHQRQSVSPRDKQPTASQAKPSDAAPRDKQPTASQAKPSDADGEQLTPRKTIRHTTRSQTRRMSQVLQSACNALISDDRRRRFLTQDLRDRRKRYLPIYAIWQMEHYTYRRDVNEWREHLKACKAGGIRPTMDMPSMPPCPSCLPSEEELQDMVKRALGKKQPEVARKIKRHSTQLNESWYCDTDHDNDSSSLLSAEAEVANVLAVSSTHTVEHFQRRGSMVEPFAV